MFNVKSFLLGIVIAIVFFMFSVYGTKLVYESPAYEDFCNFSYSYPQKIGTECNMSSELQSKLNDCFNENGVPRYEYDNKGCEKDLECDFCNKDFEETNKDYTKNLFLISLIVAIIFITISVLIIKVSAVSGGLMLGSILFIIYGTTGYWQYMEDFFRFVILGIVLAVLIWLAYYLAKRDIREIFTKKRIIKKKRR